MQVKVSRTRNSLKNPENDLLLLQQDVRFKKNGREMAADRLAIRHGESKSGGPVALHGLLSQFRDSQQVVSRTGEDEQPLHFLQTS
jgi:hypothetical protein